MNNSLETWVRRLTPPANREEVLGDLAERCATPREYRREALRTLPFVIASRIRRSMHPLGALIFGAILWAAIFQGYKQAHWAAAIIPTVLAIAVLALRDAYREQTIEGQGRAVAMDVACVALVVLLSQALLRWFAPPLALGLPTLMGGLPAGLVIIACIRLQLPTGLQPVPFLPRITMAQLRGEIDAYERIVRRAMRIELAACVLTGVMFAAFALFLPLPLIGKLGMAVGAGGAAFAALFLRREAWERPVPKELDFTGLLEAYRADMQRRVGLADRMFLRYLLPVLSGPAIFVIGAQFGKPGALWRVAVAIAIVGAVAFVFRLVPYATVRQARRRIKQLTQVSEMSAQDACA